MKILVTGSNGQLGKAIQRLAPLSPRDEYIFTDVADLDITNPEAVASAVASIEPDVIVNCAAYTNVDKAEDEPDTARLLNAEAPGILARAIAQRGGHIIHISTDYVFGGETANTPLSPDSQMNPIGVYGITKAEGEQRVAAANPRHTIIRTAWLYSEDGKNFVKTMLSLTETKPSLKVVYDQVGSPTYAGDLAAAIHHILSSRAFTEHPGTYHFTNRGVASWYDFTMAIASMAAHNDCEIAPCRSGEYPTKAQRPAYSVLDTRAIADTFGVDIPYWRDSLRRCIDNLHANR